MRKTRSSSKNFRCLEIKMFYKGHDSLLFSRLGRSCNGLNLSMIDRMYVSDFFANKGGCVSIIPGTSLSDQPLLF